MMVFVGFLLGFLVIRLTIVGLSLSILRNDYPEIYFDIDTRHAWPRRRGWANREQNLARLFYSKRFWKECDARLWILGVADKLVYGGIWFLVLDSLVLGWVVR